jgi:hypothetical protein
VCATTPMRRVGCSMFSPESLVTVLIVVLIYAAFR